MNNTHLITGFIRHSFNEGGSAPLISNNYPYNKGGKGKVSGGYGVAGGLDPATPGFFFLILVFL
jgi:hypothetical protein